MTEVLITPKNILSHVAVLRSTLGTKFVSEALEAPDSVGLNEQESSRFRANVHPLSGQWQLLVQEADKSSNAGQLYLSNSSILLMEKLHNVVSTISLQGSEKLIQDIRNPNKVNSAFFEAEIANWYVSLGFSVHFIGETTEKTPDLQITTNQGTVAIECKSLLDRHQVEGRVLSDILSSIRKDLARKKRPWRVTILCDEEEVTRSDEQAILKEIRKRIADDDLTSLELGLKGLNITFDKLAEPDAVISGEVKFDSFDFPYQIASDIRVSSTGQMQHRNPIACGTRRIFKPDQAKRVVRKLKEASRQLKSNGANIVHIEISSEFTNQTFKVIETSWEQTHKRLEDNHSRVNAVVLSGAGRHPNAKTKDEILHREFSILPNRMAVNSLPEDFRLVRNRIADDFQGISGVEGSLTFSLVFNSPLEYQSGKTIFSHISATGSGQLIVRQTLDNLLRCEIFTDKLGRIFRDFSIEPTQINKKYFFAVTFKGDDISLYLNGEKIKPV